MESGKGSRVVETREWKGVESGERSRVERGLEGSRVERGREWQGVESGEWARIESGDWPIVVESGEGS